MAAGGALAIAFECIAETDLGDEMADDVEGLLPRLEELARDSHKFRAKRERKLQRATFRDILKYFEVGKKMDFVFFFLHVILRNGELSTHHPSKHSQKLIVTCCQHCDLFLSQFPVGNFTTAPR